VSVLTIGWATRVLANVPPRALLVGETTAAEAGGPARKARRSLIVAAVAAAGAAGCGGGRALGPGPLAQAGGFFGRGALVLSALLAGLWWWMRRGAWGHRAIPGLVRLGVRNAARHPVRSLLTVGLLAAAGFMVVAVQAFHRDPGHDFLERAGGSGAFAW